jgi:ESS family glutamate:Na+ symporter
MPVAASPPFVIGPFALLLLAIPVLLFGEQLVKRVGWLGRSNIPAPIMGGLIVAIGLALVAESVPGLLSLQGSTANACWLWPVLPQWTFAAGRPTDVERPLLILFFTCIGLNASWSVARSGGLPLLIYLGLATAFAAVQTITGIATAVVMGESPLLGVMSSSVSLMGGFGTSAGFAPEFEKAGLAGASAIGIASAAFGVIAGGLIAGPVAGRLLTKKLVLGSTGTSGPGVVHLETTPRPEIAAPLSSTPSQWGSAFLSEAAGLFRNRRSILVHLAVLLVCLKLGAFLSVMIQRAGITFPVYMGSMLVAAFGRNLHDGLGGKWLSSERTDDIASIALMWLLSVVMIDLQLSQLAHAALPMLAILAVQVVLISAFAYWVVFRVMGRDYEAATMSAGLIGFGLGATSNAVATMRVLARRFGPAPRAFLIVTVVGAFLIDFTNAILITTALNLLK